MKKIISKKGNTLERLEKHELVEGVLYNRDQFGYWEFTPEQYAERAAAEAKHEAEKPRNQALAKIKKLEAEVTERRKREAILTDEGRAWLQAQEQKIQKEREKL